MGRARRLASLVILLLTLAALLLTVPARLRSAAEARLVRYPDYHAGRIAFTYLGDIWTADENGQNIRRITANKARDVYPHFSPDGKWIAFSSDRSGNLDVFIVPTTGGTPKQLTFHSADDNVLGWTPDSKSVLFASNRAQDFAGKLYTVGIEGGMPKNAGPDMGVWASYSPDGSKLALNRHGQVYWRKYYRGANATDVTIMDIAAKKFTTVTGFKGIDSWPMWSTDGFIYFVSDREGSASNGGLTNIWRVSEKAALPKTAQQTARETEADRNETVRKTDGKTDGAEQITTFKTGDVRWPSISSDGKTIVFEHDFGVWKLDVASRKTSAVPIDISTETEENTTEVRTFSSEADDYSLDPTGRRLAFSIHGEVFTAPTGQGDLTQVTDSPARDREATYAPDGKHIAFVSDRSGREEIYLASPDGAGEPQAITNLDALKLSFNWSPDSKAIAFVGSDNVLRKYEIDTRRTIELSTAKYGGIGVPAWSPDGKWIAFAKTDAVRTNHVFLVPAAGGQERVVTFDTYSNNAPHFAPNGRKLYFIRSEGFGGGGGGANAGGVSSQIYAIDLEREDHDPDDPADRPDQQAGTAAGGGDREGGGHEVTIDWNGLKRRTRQVTRMPFPVFSYTLTPDSRTIAFVTSEPAGTRTQPAIYTIQQDGKRLTRLVAGEAPGTDAEDEEPPAAAGRFGAGITSLAFARDGRTLFFKEGRGVYAVGVGAPGAGASAGGAASARAGAGAGAGGGAGAAGSGAGAGAGVAREGVRRRITFTAKVRIDRQAEWAEMFGDAWRTMKYRFYDPKMHGHDWDAMKAKYEPLVAHVGDRQELLNIINEMIGELNASHTGAAPPPQGREASLVSTGYLGVDLQPDERAGRYRVAQVYEGGPADKDWVKVSVGDYLIAINGKPVKAGDEYWQLLNYRLNRKVEVTFNSTPSDAGAWKTRIAPVSQNAQNQLRYERWVTERRQQVDKLSAGRVGYLHIQAMNQPSLRKFEKELRENRTKQALVIDERWNGGGNIDQELLGILVQREYQVWMPRGVEPNPRPFSGFFGPKVVLQNWRSASNAEMFPAGFRALGLGKVIGTPTMGAVIGTGSYSLIDGSTVRTPGVGVYLADAARTNMENYGVQPDIFVENTPEDNLAGRDRELETAVNELIKQLDQKPTTPKPTNTSAQTRPRP